MRRSYQPGGRTRWGASTSTTTTTSSSSSSNNNNSNRSVTPKHPDNQAGCDRLSQQLTKAKNENYERTLRKALRALAAAKYPVTTFKEALKLNGIGNHCARIICPLTTDEATVVNKPTATATTATATATATAAMVKKRISSKKKKDAETTTSDSFSVGSSTAAVTTTASSTTNTNTTRTAATAAAFSAKEQSYQAARKKAIDQWTHPLVMNNTDAIPGLVWKLLLIIDAREPKHELMVARCIQSGIPSEARHLPIGDMLWIAQGLRRHTIGGAATTVVEAELLMGTIIERKTTPDLVSSLFGTRYMEQRLRLKHSGQPQILFLIEGDIQKDVHPNFPKDRLQMALCETRADLGFQIVFSENMTGTVKTLKLFHRRILQRTFPQAFGFQNDALPDFASASTSAPRRRQPASVDNNINDQQQRHRHRRRRRPSSLLEMVLDTPPVPAFGEPRFMTYHELKCKIERDREQGTRTVGAIHGAMLRQVCGNQQIKAIRQLYPTPASLLKAYADCASCYQEENSSNEDGERNHDKRPEKKKTKIQQMSEMLKDCVAASSDDGCEGGGGGGGGNRKVGPKISHALYVAYCTTQNSSNCEEDEEEEKSTSSCGNSGDNYGSNPRNGVTKRSSPDSANLQSKAKVARREPNDVAVPAPATVPNSSLANRRALMAKAASMRLSGESTNDDDLGSKLSFKAPPPVATIQQTRPATSKSVCMELLSSDDDDDDDDNDWNDLRNLKTQIGDGKANQTILVGNKSNDIQKSPSSNSSKSTRDSLSVELLLNDSSSSNNDDDDDENYVLHGRKKSADSGDTMAVVVEAEVIEIE